jgi:hypothetical protein
VSIWEVMAIIIASLASINSWFHYRDIKAMEFELRDLRTEVERLNRLGSDEFMMLDEHRNRIWRLENPQGVAEVTDG